MNPLLIKNWLTAGIALVWLVNGLYCKLLHRVPRHRQIVARILGHRHANMLTRIIGVLETLLGIWILSGLYPWWCAALQIGLVATMNVIEFFLARDLLLFGKWNALFALFFMVVIFATACYQPATAVNLLTLWNS